LGEQRRIASILDAADELRTKRQQTIDQLDTLTHATFVDIFGDPVRNPKGWPVRPFESQVVEIRYGTGSPPPYVKNDEGVPFVRATDIKNGRIKTTGVKRISKADAEVLKKCKLRSGDLIIVRSGVNTGDCAVVPPELSGARVAYDIVVSLPPENAVFYHHLLDSEPGRHLVLPLTRRAAQPHLNARQIRALPLVDPPKSLRESFMKRLELIGDQRDRKHRDLEHLDILFASLQQRAFRGDL
jgi:type I restriction enzyme, S subunit